MHEATATRTGIKIAVKTLEKQWTYNAYRYFLYSSGFTLLPPPLLN